jgi:Domain of unknown function (DUF4278)
MKLTFLGVRYTPKISMVETIMTDTELSFRGNRYKLKMAQVAPYSAPAHTQLAYRSIRYTL